MQRLKPIVWSQGPPANLPFCDDADMVEAPAIKNALPNAFGEIVLPDQNRTTQTMVKKSRRETQTGEAG